VAAAAIRRFQQDFLDFQDEAIAILTIAEENPGCLVAQVYAAAMSIYSQSEEAVTAAVPPLLKRAGAVAPETTERERLLLAAIFERRPRRMEL
jgi:hypothetical protein